MWQGGGAGGGNQVAQRELSSCLQIDSVKAKNPEAQSRTTFCADRVLILKRLKLSEETVVETNPELGLKSADIFTFRATWADTKAFTTR